MSIEGKSEEARFYIGCAVDEIYMERYTNKNHRQVIQKMLQLHQTSQRRRGMYYFLSGNESNLHYMHIDKTQNIIIPVTDDVKRLL